MELAYFRQRPWARDYWVELEAALATFQYRPYVLWRMAAYKGRYIHVDSDGLRVTPGAECQESAYRVWVFGGSTVWGAGSPDGQTIPSYLQRLISRRRARPVCVTNFGQLGFTSTQGVIELTCELQHRARPDFVIFYDGVNDIVSAYGYLRAGLHLAYPEIRRRVESQRLDAPQSTLVEDLLLWSNQYRLIRRLLARPAVAPVSEPRPPSLAEDVVTTYLANVRLVTSLAKGYGFRVAFFWQPNLAVGEKPLTPSESQMRQNLTYGPFARQVHNRLVYQAVAAAGVHNLADVFSSYPGDAYIDWNHTTPEANQIIAAAIDGLALRPE